MSPATSTAEADAVRLVRSRGFTPVDTTDWSSPPTQGLHVVVASASSSPDGRAQRAFFFVGGRFIRTDVARSSAGVHIAWRNDTTIALGYAVYKPGNALCCPTGGSMIVRYQWTGGRLVALDPVPPPAVRR